MCDVLYMMVCVFCFYSRTMLLGVQGAAIDRILGEIVHQKMMREPIDYVICVGHFLGKVLIVMF